MTTDGNGRCYPSAELAMDDMVRGCWSWIRAKALFVDPQSPPVAPNVMRQTTRKIGDDGLSEPVMVNVDGKVTDGEATFLALIEHGWPWIPCRALYSSKIEPPLKSPRPEDKDGA